MHDDELLPSPELASAYLASAYLDGVAEPDERATVEASGELRATVVAFDDVRRRLGEVPPASSTVRQAAFDAAFAEFTTLHTGTAAAAFAPRATVVSLDSRRRWPGRVLAAAAAVLLVGVVGVAAQRGLGGDDAKSSSAGTVAKDADGSRTEAAPADSTAVLTPSATIGSITGAGSVALQINSLEELRALPGPAAGDQFTGTTTAAGGDTSAGAPEGSLTIASGQPTLSSVIAACLTARPNLVYLADVLWQGQLSFAVRDTVTGVTEAIDSSCTTLASVGP